jgi:hypothetical protein
LIADYNDMAKGISSVMTTYEPDFGYGTKVAF